MGKSEWPYRNAYVYREGVSSVSAPKRFKLTCLFLAMANTTRLRSTPSGRATLRGARILLNVLSDNEKRRQPRNAQSSLSFELDWSSLATTESKRNRLRKICFPKDL